MKKLGLLVLAASLMIGMSGADACTGGCAPPPAPPKPHFNNNLTFKPSFNPTFKPVNNNWNSAHSSSWSKSSAKAYGGTAYGGSVGNISILNQGGGFSNSGFVTGSAISAGGNLLGGLLGAIVIGKALENQKVIHVIQHQQQMPIGQYCRFGFDQYGQCLRAPLRSYGKMKAGHDIAKKSEERRWLERSTKPQQKKVVEKKD